MPYEKGTKRGKKKRVVDPSSKKDWCGVNMVNIRSTGKALVMGTQGSKTASDSLKGQVSEVSLADLRNDEAVFGKFKLITEDVQGKNCPTSMGWILPGTNCAARSKSGRS